MIIRIDINKSEVPMYINATVPIPIDMNKNGPNFTVPGHIHPSPRGTTGGYYSLSITSMSSISH